MSPMFSPGAVFLGSASIGSSAATVGPVNIPSGYGFLWVQFFIAGYSGSQIAILRLGSTAGTLDTGTNYSRMANHFTTSTTLSSGTATASAAGISVANDAVTNARRGIASIHNPSGANKTVAIQTVTYGAQSPTAASTIASQSIVAGTWFNTSQALCVGMNGNGVNLNANSSISVYGSPGTG